MSEIDLSTIDASAMQRELARRREIEAAERKVKRTAAEALVMEHIDALIAVTPHGRTSCSDQNVSNGIGSASWGARCTRCLLLDAKEQGYWPKDYNVQIDLPPVKIPA